MKINVVLIYFSVFAAFLNSCGNQNMPLPTQPVENQWLKDLTCSLPCWQQIIPQETSFDDVLAVLDEANTPVVFTGISANEISFQFQDNSSGTIQNGTSGMVDSIILGVYDQQITLGDIVQIVGGPEQIYVIKGPYDGDKCSVVIAFQKSGVVLDLVPVENRAEHTDKSKGCQVSIDANSVVFRIILIGHFNDSEFWKNSSYSSLDYVDWKGYGAYH
jgi:hypothetical protein